MANKSEQHQQNQSGESRDPNIGTQRGTGPRTSGHQR
jgi:hypothetical protein